MAALGIQQVGRQLNVSDALLGTNGSITEDRDWMAAKASQHIL